ncbi:MAG: hypothetical protein CM15mV25_0670 [uncultured marine virus]|nr:MAG: hypothetical protein CM15mV25_0670 [uncultured marine virus]
MKNINTIPTNKYIEPGYIQSNIRFNNTEGFKVEFQFFYGYQIDQIRNLMPHVRTL